MDKQNAAAPISVDLHQILTILAKWRWIIVLVAGLAVLTSGLISYLYLRPSYSATARLLVVASAPTQAGQSGSATPQSLQSVVQAVGSVAPVTMDTYVGELTSADFLQQVAAKLPPAPGGGRLTYADLQGMVHASAETDTNFIDVDVTAPQAAWAATIANAVAAGFLTYLENRNQAQMQAAVQYLRNEAKHVQSQVAGLQNQLIKLRSEPHPAALVQSELQARTQDLNQATAALTQAQVKVASLKAARTTLAGELQAATPTLPMTTVDPRSGRTIVTPEANPLYTTLSESLDSTVQQLAQSEAEAASLTTTLQDLDKTVGQLQAELTRKQAAEQQLTASLRQLDTAYDTITQQITETEVAQGVRIGATNVTMGARALPRNIPVAPHKGRNMALALLLGAIVGVALAFFLEFLDNTIKGVADVEAIGLSSLGQVPHYTP